MLSSVGGGTGLLVEIESHALVEAVPGVRVLLRATGRAFPRPGDPLPCVVAFAVLGPGPGHRAHDDRPRRIQPPWRGVEQQAHLAEEQRYPQQRDECSGPHGLMLRGSAPPPLLMLAPPRHPLSDWRHRRA